jgi:hypothetical protein
MLADKSLLEITFADKSLLLALSGFLVPVSGLSLS